MLKNEFGDEEIEETSEIKTNEFGDEEIEEISEIKTNEFGDEEIEETEEITPTVSATPAFNPPKKVLHTNSFNNPLS